MGRVVLPPGADTLAFPERGLSPVGGPSGRPRSGAPTTDRAPLSLRLAARLCAPALMSLFVSATAQPAPPDAADCVSYSWAGAVVLIPADPDLSVDGGTLEPGDRIAALSSDGSCVGETTWDSTGTSLTLWADDPDTGQEDGLDEGDPVTFMAYPPRGSGRRPAEVTFRFRPSASPDAGGFRADAVYVVGTTSSTELQAQRPENVLRPILPNPVDRTAQIPLSLGAAAEVRVDILDALGRRVATPFNGRLGAGDHALPFDASGLASGVYVCWVRSRGRVFQRRFTVAR